MRFIKVRIGLVATDFPEGKVIFNTATYVPYILNATAAEIWDFCKTGRSEKEIIKYLCSVYSIDTEVARRDVSRLAKELKRKGLIETYVRKK